MTQLTDQDPKFWAPEAPVWEFLSKQIDDKDYVLDVGPGRAPFPRADVYVDYNSDFIPMGKLHHICDLSVGNLPFRDKEFDFVYARHVLEDMCNPFLLCEEMSRVGKRGYIETPSPMAEFCRGVDGGSPPWRGYHHHRFIIWDKDGELQFVSKFPIIEYIQAPDVEASLLYSLRAGSKYWNTRYLWEGSIRYKHLQCPMDFDIRTTYPNLLHEAIRVSCQANDRFFDRLNGTD